MTVNEMLQMLDEELDFPRPQRPSRGQRIHALLNSLQQLVNESNNTPAPRIFTEAFFTTTPGQAYAELAAPNFGQALFVEPEDGVMGDYELEIVPFQNITHYAQGLASLSPAGGGTIPDVRWVAFQTIGAQGASLRVHCRPVPLNTARYRVHYKIGKYEPALGTEPPLSQFHPLVVYQAALNLVGKSQWLDESEKKMTDHRNEIRTDIAPALAQHRRDWENFKVTNHQARSSRRLLFGDEDEGVPVLPAFFL